VSSGESNKERTNNIASGEGDIKVASQGWNSEKMIARDLFSELR
jgi:hypothetical protein